MSVPLFVGAIAVGRMHPGGLGESVALLTGLFLGKFVVQRMVAVDGDRLLDEALDRLELCALVA